MSKNRQYFFIILGLGALIFYLLPPIFGGRLFMVALVLFINPIYSLIFPLLYTIQFGLKIHLPIAIGILFIPAVFFYYGLPMLMYSVVYASIAFVGCCAGYPIHCRYHKN